MLGRAAARLGFFSTGPQWGSTIDVLDGLLAARWFALEPVAEQVRQNHLVPAAGRAHFDDDDLELAERFFSRPEATALRALAPEQRIESFFHAWTRKEAFLKASAHGLTYGLDRVEVTLLHDEPAAKAEGSSGGA